MSSAQEDPKPEKPSLTPAPFGLSPKKMIERAERSHPVFKLLWGILAIVGVASVVVASGNPHLMLFGGLIVFLLLMVLYVSVGLGNPSKGTLAESQPRALSLFLAWSSALLMVLAMVALFASIFFDAPVHLRGTFFREANATEISGLETEERVFGAEWLDEPHARLKDKTLTDAKVRGLFQRKSFPIASVKLLKRTAKDPIRTVGIQIWGNFDSIPLLLCDLDEGSADFVQVRDAVELSW
jgi:hypothetical protein